VKIGNRKEEWLDDNSCTLGLADSEKKRAESYAAWTKETIAAGEWELIRLSLQRGQLTGSLSMNAIMEFPLCGGNRKENRKTGVEK
jgi:hypothetical protein